MAASQLFDKPSALRGLRVVSDTTNFRPPLLLLVRDVVGLSLPNHVTNLSHSESVFHGISFIKSSGVCVRESNQNRPSFSQSLLYVARALLFNQTVQRRCYRFLLLPLISFNFLQIKQITAFETPTNMRKKLWFEEGFITNVLVS